MDMILFCYLNPYGGSLKLNSVEVHLAQLDDHLGPEIELIPERKATIQKDICRVTSFEESYLSDEQMVSFDLIKIYWTRDENYESIKAMYVSRTVKVSHLHQCLAKHTNINPHKSILTGRNEEGTEMEYGSSVLTLADYKIFDNHVVNITQRSSNDTGIRSNGKENNTDIGNIYFSKL
jgi:hypothetical protein